MAAAFFNACADPHKAQAVSAGTDPAERVHSEVVMVMQEIGLDLSLARPQKLTSELARDANLLVTMGCGDQCPFVAGLRREDWPLPDPKGRDIHEVRLIRDQIRSRIQQMIEQEQLSPISP